MKEESQQRSVVTVSQLNREARVTSEQRFSQVWVTGELSNFARPRSGHWYFTLKDDGAQVRCAMFANRNMRVSMQPSDGGKSSFIKSAGASLCEVVGGRKEQNKKWWGAGCGYPLRIVRDKVP